MAERIDVEPQPPVLLEEPGTGIEAEKPVEDEKIVQPFDPTRIRVESKPITVDLLRVRIENNELNLAPDFQRKAGIWSEAAQSRLIESMLIRIPLPAFYMDATDEDHWIVIDGLQRLTTLHRFMIQKTLRLSGMEFLTQLNGKNFDQLPRNFQRRIEETQVTMYLIEKGTPPEVKFNIFKRINTGGLPLSSQEIRHALNQGEATRCLARLASSREFLQATSDSIKDDRMADRECVLRFLAFFMSPYPQYRSKNFDAFLNDRMADINRMSSSEVKQLETSFLSAMSRAYRLFGNYAFRKRYELDAPRYPINKALFEAWSVNLARLADNEFTTLESRKEALNAKFMALMYDPSFGSAVTQGTGDHTKVRTRFHEIERIIREVLTNDPPSTST